MAYVNDSDRGGIDDPIEDLIPIGSNVLDADIRIGRSFGAVWLLSNGSNAVIDGADDVAGASGTSFLEVSKDFVDVGKCARPICDFHVMPRRFQNAATSSSVAKPLRSASSMAVRSSSLRM